MSHPLYIPILETGFYYLAAPYGDSDPTVVEQRMLAYEKMDAYLSSLGHKIMSPLDKHYKLKHESLPGNYTYWQKYCEEMLALCKGLIVITLSGWETSVGVRDEIRMAVELDIPVYTVTPI